MSLQAGWQNRTRSEWLGHIHTSLLFQQHLQWGRQTSEWLQGLILIEQMFVDQTTKQLQTKHRKEGPLTGVFTPNSKNESKTISKGKSIEVHEKFTPDKKHDPFNPYNGPHLIQAGRCANQGEV